MTIKETIDFIQTEQWEVTAFGYGLQATGSNEVSAERNLLRLVVKKLQNRKI